MFRPFGDDFPYNVGPHNDLISPLNHSYKYHKP